MSLRTTRWHSRLRDKTLSVTALCGCSTMPSRTALFRHLLIILFLLMGFGVATFVGWQRHQGEQKRWENQLVQWCKERSTMLELDIVTNAHHVQVFTAFVEEFKKELLQDSSRSQRYMDRTAYARPSVYSVDWSMVVLDKDRSVYESYWNTTIKDESTGLSMARLPVYYPITLVPSNINHMRFVDKQTISLLDNSWEAALRGEFVITPPCSFDNRPSTRFMLMCWPTFKQRLPENATLAERVAAVDGMITAVFIFDTLVEKFLSRWAASQPFSFHVYDVTDPVSPSVLYIPEREVALNASMERNHLKHVMKMDFGDSSRNYEMWCWRKKQSICRSSIVWGTSIAVVVILIACVLWATIRCMEMAEENYQKMEKLKTEAEAADRAKSSFLATMSHELRTPMNGVLGMLNILKDTNLDTQQLEYARTASSCANALITLVNDILDLAKVESGHMDLERTPFDFRAICGEVLLIFQEQAKKKNVELATLVAPDVPTLVYGDPVRLRQVFINFVGNSLKFTREGHIFLRVSVAKPVRFPLSKTSISGPNSARNSGDSNHSTAKFGTLSGRKTAGESNSWEALTRDSSEVVLGSFWHTSLAVKGERRERQSKVLLQCSCEDTGVGIPVGVQHRIFNPFIQADSSTTREYGGTGIGLSICQKLIGMMGSEVKLVSKLGVGSTFYFSLEMDVVARPSGDSRESRSSTNQEQMPGGFARLKGCRTLVAAPRLVRRLVLVDALQALGMEVAVVDEIKDAVTMICQGDVCGEGVSAASLPISTFAGPAGWTGSRSPDRGRRDASGVKAGDIGFDCLVVDADDWGSDYVLDLAKMLWAHRQRRGPGSHCMPVVLVAGCSFTPEMEERIDQIPCATKLQKPMSSSSCGTAIMKALGQATETPGIEKSENPQTKENSIRGIHVLVVDDNLVNRKVACKFLEKRSINSTAVDSAARAIAALAEGHTFDAVFMDIQMPEMDGIEATQILRSKEVKSQNPARGRIPIFAMTADVMKDKQVQCREAGMDGFIPKPLDPHKMFDVMTPFFPPP